MLLLALDTATSAVTAALHDGTRTLAASSVISPQGHGELLAPAIRTVLAQAGVAPADLTEVVTGIGPGPFTGLRVGVVTAATFAHALGIPVHGLCSLDAIAHQVHLERGPQAEPGQIVVATDARRREVYWAQYELTAAGIRACTQPAVDRAADISEEVGALPVAGRGGQLYPECFGDALPVLDVDAAALADLAATRLHAGVCLPGIEPLYLRRPDAVPSTKTKSVLRQR
ncbi:tRNA (adenosine(37)-N6)-threonylcarbamoyltransferase complex dimerization subunit type 1 TsaB [Gephyromycinifex aptenodytis]|uniref:tRNA (adenosine(37)-N6)-threonylcarbamoyltransferase complex dimerization subunit type 1 TsaB n=1 Tax=Gephyromycinifex aptenodytis TaxID=2716227 RepID=UPI00144884A4|nr:tRNA (adenosine(37)-N6)-threonylcarbamoyltransferase complex dimerization subunit type 1 TsaB [Gephyromycinifex aptenodytis]